jgi:hypothetical protein
LFSPCCPSAIAGFVIPVVVDAVKGEVGRPFTHIGKEVYEVEPLFANCDTATSIVLPDMAFGVGASSYHRSPRSIGSGYAGLMRWGMAVSGLGFSLSLKAPATGCVTARKVVADSDTFSSTVASVDPACVSVLCMREAQNSQASKSLPCEISEGGHV